MIYLILVIILILYVIIVDKIGMGIPCLFVCLLILSAQDAVLPIV